jgi:hypothetical protein
MAIETGIAISETTGVDRDKIMIAPTGNRAKAGAVVLMTKNSGMPARVDGAANSTAPAEPCTEEAAITSLAIGEAKAKTIAT